MMWCRYNCFSSQCSSEGGSITTDHELKEGVAKDHPGFCDTLFKRQADTVMLVRNAG